MPKNTETQKTKIQSLAALQKTVLSLRRQDKRCVFTNGCFDLIHVGHVRYLSAARALGDVLIVGVNADRSVRRLKGPSRPIVPQRERLEILSAFWFVDYLILFAGQTPLRLITALKPDILVKGGDWPLDQIVGREAVEKQGGQVVRIKTVPGASTTSIIERVLKNVEQTK